MNIERKCPFDPHPRHYYSAYAISKTPVFVFKIVPNVPRSHEIRPRYKLKMGAVLAETRITHANRPPSFSASVEQCHQLVYHVIRRHETLSVSVHPGQRGGVVSIGWYERRKPPARVDEYHG